MFGLRVLSFPGAAAPAMVAADGGGGGGADGTPPRSSKSPPSTSSSSLTPVELLGASSSAPARQLRVPYTIKPNSIIQIYRSSPEYASAMLRALGHTAAKSASDDSLFPPWRGKVILALAIPKSCLPDEFIKFCGVHVKHASNILIIKNDAVEDRYSALFTFKDQKSADSFYWDINGWSFSDRGEVCHVIYVAALEFSTETASSIPNESTEFPTCPVCIERLGDISGLAAAGCDHSKPCSCFLLWANSSCSVCLFRQQHEFPSCDMCQFNSGLSVCMLCGFIGCGRFREGHSKKHHEQTGHSYALDLDTWKLCDKAHVLDCSRSDVEHATQSFRDLLRSKVEKAIDEQNCLFSRAFEAQRQYYKTMLTEAKGGRELYISEAVKKAVNDKHQELQLKLKSAMAEGKEVERMNKKLAQSTDKHLQLVAKMEKREREQLELKDKEIREIEDEIKDYKYSLNVKDSVEKNDSLKQGTILPSEAPDTGSEGKGRCGGKRKK